MTEVFDVDAPELGETCDVFVVELETALESVDLLLGLASCSN